MLWLDSYERRARLVPGLLIVAPIGIVIVMFGLNTNPAVAVIIGSLTTFGTPVVLANFVRHRGLAAQSTLYKMWGGKPTTTLLMTGPAARRSRWRQAVARVSNQDLPPEDQPDPDGAYDAATAVVLSKTRDAKQFGMVFAENRNYGYERNLYGSKRLGLSLAWITLVGAAIAVGLLIDEHHKTRAEWVIGLVALLGLAVLWLVLPSEKRAKTTAFKYAEQLLDAAVELDTNQTAP